MPVISRNELRMGIAMARILLIDDDVEFSEFVRSALEATGHQVECLDRANQAVEILSAVDFDVVHLSGFDEVLT